MTTFEEALDAKAILRKRLGRPPWLRGIGVAKNESGSHVLKVNVSEKTPEVSATIPRAVGEVQIVIDEIGDISSQA